MAWETLNANFESVTTPDVSAGRLDSVVQVRSVDDLPTASGGSHTLEDFTGYRFHGFVTSSNSLELGTSTPIKGFHGSKDGFIHTGGNAAVIGTNAAVSIKDMYLHAPGGSIFNVTGDGTTEMLVESCSFSDAAGLGNIGSLGTINGIKIPSLTKVNMGDFNDGLTFDGSGEKIFIQACPARDVTAAGVDIFTLASTADYPEVDHVDSYVKNVQSDTTVWQVESGGEPSSVLQYRGVLHDTTFGGQPQAVAGALDTQSVGVRVKDSFPLTDWAVNGDLDIDGAATVSSAGTTTEVVSANFSAAQTFTLSEQLRTSKEANEGGRLQYDAKDNAITRVFLIISLTAPTTNVSVFIGKNGSDLERSQSRVETGGAGSPVTVPATTNVRLDTGDYVSAYVRDDDASNDIEIETMALTLGPA